MSRTDHKPGPEVDALVATAVMEWHLSEDGFSWLDEQGETHRGPDIRQEHDDGGYCIWVNPWSPSTSIADALGELWDELERRGMSPGIYKRGNVYRAHADVATNHWEEHPQKAMAFTLAALRAVGAIE